MPSKKKKYNARFPAGRIKKIMQRDEEVGKVAQAVPIIISRTLELFVESLLKRAMNITISKSAKTLSPSHMKQCILSESRFDFLKDLVKDIPDVSSIEDMGEFVPGSTSTVVRSTTNTDIGYLPRTPSAQQPDLSMELAFPVIEQTTVMDLTMKTNKNDFDETPTPPNFYKEITSQDSVIRYTPQTPEPKLITHSVHNIINKSQRPSKLPKQSPSFNTTDYPRSEPAYNIQISPTLLSENKFETDLDNGPVFHLDFTKNLGKPPPLIPIVRENNVNNPGNKPGFNPLLNAQGHQLAQHLDEDYDA